MPTTDSKGEQLDSYSNIKIFHGFPYNSYLISSPAFPEKEEKFANGLVKVLRRESAISTLQQILPSSELVDDFRRNLLQTIDMNSLNQKLPSRELMFELNAAMLSVAKKAGISKPKQFADYVLNKSIGYREIAEMMADPHLEEIMVNGYGRNVFVFHHRYGMCKTNVLVKEHGFVLDLIMRIAQTVGKQFNEAHPLLDARLPDGSRANSTFSYVTPFGHSLTIRKFSKVPLSIINLIENNTLDAELAAFLWAMVEGLNVDPMNIIVTGGAGSGKTTFMNVLSAFIPYQSRVLSIEDTLELDLGARENWIQMESKPKLKDVSEVTMDDLLKNALRMRPDRILVGEVRGEEAQTLFVAMDTGHRGILGTLHSNTAREMLLRLKSSPMTVPEPMLPLLDLAVVMQRTYSSKEGMLRRVKHVAEIGRMEEKVLLSNIFELDTKKNLTERTSVPSHVIETLAERAGMSKKELKREIIVRQRILEWMIANDMRDSDQVEQLIQKYYFDPASVLEEITSQS